MEASSDWDEFVGHATRLGPDCFIATTSADGKPHLSVVSPGYTRTRLVIATWKDSVKARNIAEGPAPVMLHWVVDEATNNDMLLLRGTAYPVVGPTRRNELWESGVLPYNAGDYYVGPGDPKLLWVETEPTYASLERSFGEGARTVWRF